MRLALPVQLTLFAGLCGLATTSLQAQYLGQAPDTNIAWWRVLGTLLFCLALAVGAAFALRARTGLSGSFSFPGLKMMTSPSRRLRLVERIRLSSGTDLCLVRLDETEMLVSATPTTVEIIRTLAEPVDKGGDT